MFRNLLAVARAADPDPWRDALHDSLSRSDSAPLIRLAGESGLEQHDPIMLWFLGYGLEVLGEHDRALDVLTRARRAHPGDFWLNTELGLVYMQVKRSGPAATSSLIATGAFPGTRAGMPRRFSPPPSPFARDLRRRITCSAGLSIAGKVGTGDRLLP